MSSTNAENEGVLMKDFRGWSRYGLILLQLETGCEQGATENCIYHHLYVKIRDLQLDHTEMR